MAPAEYIAKSISDAMKKAVKENPEKWVREITTNQVLWDTIKPN